MPLTSSSTPTPVVDQQGHVITVLAGHPDDPNWDNLHQDVADMLENFRAQCKFSDDQCKHRCGRFPALSYGISYGGGQTVRLLLFVNTYKPDFLPTAPTKLAPQQGQHSSFDYPG